MKKNLSDELWDVRIVLIIFMLIPFAMIILHCSSNEGPVDELLGSLFPYLLALGILGLFLYWSYTQTEIYFDDEYLYIKEYKSMPMTISLSSVSRLKARPVPIGKLSYGRFDLVCIDHAGHKKKVDFYYHYRSSENIKSFITAVKAKNPDFAFSDWVNPLGF